MLTAALAYFLSTYTWGFTGLLSYCAPGFVSFVPSWFVTGLGYGTLGTFGLAGLSSISISKLPPPPPPPPATSIIGPIIWFLLMFGFITFAIIQIYHKFKPLFYQNEALPQPFVAHHFDDEDDFWNDNRVFRPIQPFVPRVQAPVGPIVRRNHAVAQIANRQLPDRHPVVPRPAGNRPVPRPAENRPVRPRESDEAFAYRRSILRQFKCPFQEENACRSRNLSCLFSHVETSLRLEALQTDLKDVPPYVCVYHLVNNCRTTAEGNAPNGAPQAGVPNGTQPRPCPSGLHPSLEEMLRLPEFERRNRRQIARFNGPDNDRECGVCQETVRSKHLSRNRLFAILENCQHCFCFGCIKSWQEAAVDGMANCPMCRQATGRILFRRRFITDATRKRELFQNN